MTPAKKHLSPVVIIMLGFAAFWMGLVLLFAAQVMLASDQTWTQALRGALILWVPWMAVSPLMLVAAYLLPLGSTPLIRFLPGHLVISVVLIFMAGWLSRNVMPLPDHTGQDQPTPGPGPAAQANGYNQPPLGPGPNNGSLQPGDPGYGPLRPGDPGFVPPPRPGEPGFVPPRPGEPGFQGPLYGANGQLLGPDGQPLGPGARRGQRGALLGPRPLGAGQGQPNQAVQAATGLNAFSAAMLRTLPVGLPLYLTSLLLVGSLNLRRISLEKEWRAAELETQLADARLETLRSQLHPHFLFNTLNALMSLVHTDPAKAEEMILCLSSLLRATLEAKDKPRIPLRDELQLAHDYLAIQSLRYGERLRTQEYMPPETLACTVPPLILQLVLENAIKYAIDRNAAGGLITVRAERLGEKLIIEVEDSGSGRNAESRESHGVGVANVRARLVASFPGRAVSFDLLPNQHGGITARFQLPVAGEIEDGAAS